MEASSLFPYDICSIQFFLLYVNVLLHNVISNLADIANIVNIVRQFHIASDSKLTSPIFSRPAQIVITSIVTFFDLLPLSNVDFGLGELIGIFVFFQALVLKLLGFQKDTGIVKHNFLQI